VVDERFIGGEKKMKSAKGRPEDRLQVHEADADESRREMLTKIGRFVYAAPALILLAEPKSVQAYGTRPGWGYGDPNHTHSGPPGQTGSRRNK
jgi:hypothetical protein